ncbi:MAG: NAD(P)/FAD-dependent oxidoreductase [Bacteroidota bacterium]
MQSKVEEIAILGAGLVGSLLAVYMVKRGYRVTIYERRSDPRKSDADSGRSINLALSNRGWKSLEAAGVANQVAEMIIPMRGRMMHDQNSMLTFQPYGRLGQAINSVSRSGLNLLLLNAAESYGVKTFFQHRCQHVDFENSKVYLDYGGKSVLASPDLIIGADGAFSAVRSSLQKTDRFNFSQYYLEHGYKELEIPAGPDSSFLLEKHALHIWPRKRYMLIALPNPDATFTCTLFLPFEGETSFQSLDNEAAVKKFFKKDFPDAFELMPDLVAEFNSNPTSSLVTVQCYPWVKHKTLIIGDASHAIVPFYGQGMNSGFEDCLVLNDMIDTYDHDWGQILDNFQKVRKEDADAISHLALQNFIEMRDKVADPTFLLQKKIESRLHELFPDRWIPLYSMVTFNPEIRYSEALRNGKRQQSIMDEVMSKPDIEKHWESLNYEEIVSKLEVQ